jgi:hypothetical protein
MKLHELYRKELESGEAIRQMVDNNRGVTVSIVEVQSETLSKFLDAIEALESIINHPLSEKAWIAGQTALNNLEVGRIFEMNEKLLNIGYKPHGNGS